jgi:hypothetical protein
MANFEAIYERFTDRARKVMALANQEAQRFNHEYIGTEHILLGLVKEGSGVGANVLRELDIDLRRIRVEIEKIVKSGPDMITMGKLPHTPRTKKVLAYAVEEAALMNHNYVGTEHLVLGLIREQDGVASQVLQNLGVKLEELRETVLNLLGFGHTDVATVAQKIHADDGLAALRMEVDQAIRNADYELAAQLRDKLTALQKAEEKYGETRRKASAAQKALFEYMAALAVNGQIQQVEQVLTLCRQLEEIEKTDNGCT